MDMQPFRDSGPLVEDGAALAERLEEEGYLFLPGLLPREAVMAVRRRLLARAAAGGWLRAGTAPEAGIAEPAGARRGTEPVYFRRARNFKVFRGMWADEQLHRLRHHPRVLALFERVLGEAVLMHPMFVLRNIFPRSERSDFTTGPHQDRVYIGGGQNFAMWVPLGDCPVEKGPLAIAAGSHRRGVLDVEIGTGAGALQTSEADPGSWVTGDFAAGDVVIFSDTTVHKALPNRSRELRQSFDARYQKLSLPVADMCMRPYADIFTWDEVYAGWEAEDLCYYWQQQNPKIVPYENPHYEKRDQIAFDMAERGDITARDALLRVIQRDRDATKRDRARRLLRQLEAGMTAG